MPRRVMSPGSPGPAPIKYTLPTTRASSGERVGPVAVHDAGLVVERPGADQRGQVGGLLALGAGHGERVRREHRIGALADNPSNWQKQTSPDAAGWKSPESTNVALVLDAARKPLIVYYSEQEDGVGRRVFAWRPGAAPVVAFESKASTDFPNLALTSGGGRLGLLVANPLDPDKSDYSISYVSSPDGATWSTPSVIPPDGPRSTNHPQDVAIDSHGNVTAVFGSNSGSAVVRCIRWYARYCPSWTASATTRVITVHARMASSLPGIT